VDEGVADVKINQWRVKFALSGGFVGLRKTVELSNAGRMILSDEKKKRRVTVQLSGEDVNKITGLMVEARQLQPVDELPYCADCYQYQLYIHIDKRDFFFQANDLNLVESGLARLVKALMALQERAASGQAN
jgi:hypothetical protein